MSAAAQRQKSLDGLDKREDEPMILPLFLDSEDRRFFSNEARAAIRDVCSATEPHLRKSLPMLPQEIEVAVQTGSVVIPETGEVGSAMTPTRVSWTVDPERPEGIAVVARSQLRATLFHECHHLVRGWVFNGGAPRTSFMDGVVSEGLATAFERDAGGRHPPWGEYPQDVHGWVAELLELPISASYQEWMFQHPDGRRWIGYRAGTFLADQAMAASGRDAAELVAVPTSEILEMAGFSGRK